MGQASKVTMGQKQKTRHRSGGAGLVWKNEPNRWQLAAGPCFDPLCKPPAATDMAVKHPGKMFVGHADFSSALALRFPTTISIEFVLDSHAVQFTSGCKNCQHSCLRFVTAGCCDIKSPMF
jgi:hypothetical protein